MKENLIGGKTYELDPQGFLIDHEQWDEDFALKMAARAGIEQGLTRNHWEVISFIRDSFKKTGKCPLVYETCRANGLSLWGLKELFPAGYLRGACRLAGLTYREGYIKYSWPEARFEKKTLTVEGKTYEVDYLGFLVDPSRWDENFALHQAHEMRIQGGLSDEHWRVIRFLREYFDQNGALPTVYGCCEANHLELEDCERLFPDGYHRGAVKMAGLLAR
jgi:TusE/DsrC/DsvC family sulfur relay protein